MQALCKQGQGKVNPMFFYMPTKVFEQKNCVVSHGPDIATLGKKALIVTGKHSAVANGAFDDVRIALESNGVSWELFNEVEENPSIETVMRGREKALSFGAELVVGIGGGSPLDAAKAIALMAYHKNEGAAYLYKKGADSTCLPVVAVPTTCGTGSEVTGVSVLTIHEKKTKGSISHKIFPVLALVDGKYLGKAPVSVLRNTAVDAFAHMVESYVNSAASDYCRMCVAKGLELWASVKDVLVEGRAPAEDEAFTLMRASTFGGMAIAQDGTSLPHGLSYPLTYGLGLPHGKAVGYFQAGYLAEASAADRDFILGKSGFRNLEEWQAFYAAVCGSEKLPENLLENAVSVLSQNKAKLAAAPFDVDEKVLRRIVFF